MQPYFFPYPGYFQLIRSADTFVLYDDVNYIKGGWINRNRLPNGKDSFYFTLPLRSKSSFMKISEILIDSKSYEIWKQKFIKTIRINYGQTASFKHVMPWLESVLILKSENLSQFLFHTISETCKFLNIKTQIIETSRIYNNETLKGTNRIIDICIKENADEYINATGGQDLYFKPDFEKERLKLLFIKNKVVDNDFGMSIIHNLFVRSETELKNMIINYELE